MSAEVIPFEIHITVGELTHLQGKAFKNICLELSAKPVFIELSRGNARQQPMFSKVLKEKDLPTVVRLSEQYVSKLEQVDMIPRRLKIEVPFNEEKRFKVDHYGVGKRYYEWHGKVPYERVDNLLQLCEAHHVHVSHNALKDEQNLRFITLRESGSSDEFSSRVNELCEALRIGGWQVSKNHFEYCLLDTNISLDKGWLI